jgi:hypothetical protein
MWLSPGKHHKFLGNKLNKTLPARIEEFPLVHVRSPDGKDFIVLLFGKLGRYQCSGRRSTASSISEPVLWSRSNCTISAECAACMWLKLKLSPSYWTLAPFSNKRRARGTVSKSAARSRGVGSDSLPMIYPDCEAVSAMDVEGWKTTFNDCA